MIYKYDVYLGTRWKTGKVAAASVEAAAAFIKKTHQIEERNTTIVLWEDCEELDEIKISDLKA